MYTMRDVNKLSNQSGWPQHMALSYYIELAATTGATVASMCSWHMHNTQTSRRTL